MKPLLRWTRWLLLVSSVALLAYCAFVAGDAWIFQRSEDRQLERLLTARAEASSRELPAASPVSLASLSPSATGGLIGRMDVSRLGLSAIVMEGTGNATLRRAVGHIAGTALPGQPGNVGISGHRDTFFRPLRKIQPNDIITLTTTAGEYRYRVVSTKVVAPDDVAVLEPGEDETLTLVTCYPFYFVGPAPNRFIVRAQRVV